MSERLYLLGPPDHVCFRAPTFDFSDLANIPLILPGSQHAVRRLLEDVASRQQVKLQVQLEVNAYPAITSIVTALRGFTVLPVAPILADVQCGNIAAVEIVNPNLIQRVGLLTPSPQPVSLSSKTVSRVIGDLAKKFAASGIWPEGLRA